MPRKIVAEDENSLAAKSVSAVTGTPVPSGVLDALLKRQAAAKKKVTKNPAAVALGKLGGLKGGKARAESLSAAKRSEIAKAAAKARWGNKAKLRASLKKAMQNQLTTEEVAERLGIKPEAIREILNPSNPLAG